MAIARDGTGAAKILWVAVSDGAQTITFTTNASRHLVVSGGTFVNPPTVSDSGSGTWVVKSKTGAGTEVAFVCYRENAASVTTVSLNLTGGPSNNFGGAKLDQYTGVATSASFESQTTADGSVGSATWASGNHTTTSPNALVVASAVADDSDTQVWTSTLGSWTELAQDGNSTNSVPWQSIFQIAAGSTGPYSITFNYPPMGGTGSAGANIVVSFAPVAAPTITQQPGNTNVVLGAPATFSVDATGPSTPTYQWQDDSSGSFANVSGGTGATTNTYTTAVTTSLFQRRNYRCVVTDGTSVNSNSANLTLTYNDVFLYEMPEDTDPDDVRLRDPTMAGATPQDPGITPWFDDSIEYLEASDWNDHSCFVFYSSDPLADNVVVQEQPASPEFPDEYLSENNDDFPDYWSQAPPIDDNYEAFTRIEDASTQPEYIEDQDQLGFDISPLADDNDVAVTRVVDSSEQLEDVDEDFGFAISIPDDPVAETDFIEPEDSADQLEDVDEDYGFSIQPLADDFVAPQDQIVVDDSSDQLEDVDDDYGFSVPPLAEDNDVGIPASFPDQSEEPELEDFFFSADPLPNDVQSDQVFTELANTREEDVGDEDFGFTFDQAVPELFIEQPLPFCVYPDQSEEPEDEDFAFEDFQTPDDVFIVVVPPPDVVSAGVRRRKERYIARYKGEEYEFSTLEDLEQFVSDVKKAEQSKPKRVRSAIKISLSPDFMEEIEEYIEIPRRIQLMPVPAAMAQIRRIDGIFKKMRDDEDDDEETLIWLI
jgi:hypothetical protein